MFAGNVRLLPTAVKRPFRISNCETTRFVESMVWILALISARSSLTGACGDCERPLRPRLRVNAAAPPRKCLRDIPDIPTSEHKLQAGDRLLFYTDGITERQNPAGEMFEVEGIEAAMRNSADLQSEQLMNSIVAGMESFASGSEPHDDQTLLLITVG